MNPSLSFILLPLTTFLLAACGYQGALYLPDKSPASKPTLPSPTPVAAASSPSTLPYINPTPAD